MIHSYTPGKYLEIRAFYFQRVHKRKIGLNWVKQLRNELIQLQGEHLLQHLQKRILISKKEQDLQFARQKSKT